MGQNGRACPSPPAASCSLFGWAMPGAWQGHQCLSPGALPWAPHYFGPQEHGGGLRWVGRPLAKPLHRPAHAQLPSTVWLLESEQVLEAVG